MVTRPVGDDLFWNTLAVSGCRVPLQGGYRACRDGRELCASDLRAGLCVSLRGLSLNKPAIATGASGGVVTLGLVVERVLAYLDARTAAALSQESYRALLDAMARGCG